MARDENAVAARDTIFLHCRQNGCRGSPRERVDLGLVVGSQHTGCERDADQIGARLDLQFLSDARNSGTAVLLVSEDLDELIELSDRLCVMFDGAIVHETTPGATDTITIGRYMAGSLSDRASARPEAAE